MGRRGERTGTPLSPPQNKKQKRATRPLRVLVVDFEGKLFQKTGKNKAPLGVWGVGSGVRNNPATPVELSPALFWLTAAWKTLGNYQN